MGRNGKWASGKRGRERGKGEEGEKERCITIEWGVRGSRETGVSFKCVVNICRRERSR